jgi:predicted RNA-binding protein
VTVGVTVTDGVLLTEDVLVLEGDTDGVGVIDIELV